MLPEASGDEGMVNVTPLTVAVVMAAMIATVLVALAIGLPWYHTENTVTHHGIDYYLDYGKSESSGFFEYPRYELEDLQFLMWVEKVFTYIWIVLAIVFVGTCLIDEKWESMLSGFCIIAVSIFVLVYFAARIEKVHDWSGETSAGFGYMLVLVAFVMQFLAIIGRAWHTLPWVVNDLKQKGGETKS
ncbi:MAG: hypothetical protein A3K60_08025 [Euryarchaeota archaeon RBG_19FT_COMBO_56_21]|nr:MAG: hypothetical protein A3K60_08025 [Euryarchaeota archaeon RBG_19FT_COMBO_56_21]